MKSKTLFISKLIDLLNNKYNYAILRSYKDLPDNYDSHDIDILLEKKQYKQLKTDLSLLLKQEGFSVLMVNENERFNTIIIAKTVNSKLEFLYLDFFFNFSLYGISLMESNAVLQQKEFNGKVYHVSKLHEYLEKYLNCKLLNQSYPLKYKEIKEEVYAKHKEDLNEVFNIMFSDKSVTIKSIENYSGKKLLIKVFIANLLRCPIKQIRLSISFFYYHFKGKFKPNGFSFSLTGPDGSGKTTILNSLQDELSKVYRETTLNHFRPTVIPRIAELFKKTGLKSEIDENYSNPHRGAKTGKISSIIRLFYYITDYIVGYFKIVKPVLFRRGVVIFDRYYTDIITDSRRSKINLNYKFIFLFRRIVPKLKYNFIIFVKPEIILKRKQELTTIQIEEIYEKLNYVCKNDSNYLRINNDGEPEIAISEILNIFLEKQDYKYLNYF